MSSEAQPDSLKILLEEIHYDFLSIGIGFLAAKISMSIGPPS